MYLLTHGLFNSIFSVLEEFPNIMFMMLILKLYDHKHTLYGLSPVRFV